MHFDNVNLTRPCRLVSRNARKMGTTHGRTQHTLKGTVRQIFSPPSFACDFHGRNRDKFYICSQALLIIYHEVKGGGGGRGRGRKEEVWGITWFSLLPESIQTGL